MKSAGINEIKQELQHRSPKELMELCLRLAKYKKDNKELLAYLLFEAHDAEAYTSQIKESVMEMFKEMNTSNVYYAKKTIRKILRLINKQIKYISSKQPEIELRIFFCEELKATGLALQKNKALHNLYSGQLKKIKVLLSVLHEDVQYDLMKQIEHL